jgi:hypothetical protein
VRIFRIGPGSRTGSPQQPEVAKSAKARDGFALGKQSEGNQPDVAAAVRALERKLLRHPRLGVSPKQSGRCRASGAFEARRSSLPWRDRRPHARRQRRRTACRCCRWRAPGRLFAACDSAQTPRDTESASMPRSRFGTGRSSASRGKPCDRGDHGQTGRWTA